MSGSFYTRKQCLTFVPIRERLAMTCIFSITGCARAYYLRPWAIDHSITLCVLTKRLQVYTYTRTNRRSRTMSVKHKRRDCYATRNRKLLRPSLYSQFRIPRKRIVINNVFFQNPSKMDSYVNSVGKTRILTCTSKLIFLPQLFLHTTRHNQEFSLGLHTLIKQIICYCYIYLFK